MSRAARRIGPLGLLLVGGCAQRGLASGPADSHGAGTWVPVTIAAVAATLVWAALLVAPAQRPGGSRLAAAVLGIQAGAATVGGAVLTGMAVRSAQLMDRPADAEQAASLVRLSGLDGREPDFFRLMAVLVVVLGVLLVAVLAIAARYAAGVDLVQRLLACGVLALESLLVALAVVLGALGVLGDAGWGIVATAATLPALALALVSCWPPREADDQRLGYNGGHG